MATLKEAVKRLVDAAEATKAQVDPLKAALVTAQEKYDAYFASEEAEDVQQNSERDALKADLAAALAEAQEAVDAINAEADKLTGVSTNVPVEDVPDEGNVDLPPVDDSAPGDNGTPVEVPETPADADAPADAPAVEANGTQPARDADGNPVV